MLSPEVILPRHCSSLPRELACPAAMLSAAHKFSPESDAASLGRAGHEAIAARVMGASPDLDALAEAHDCDRDELGILYFQASKILTELGQWMRNPQVEVGLNYPTGLICGTADLVDADDNSAIVLDWKFGRVEANPWPQLKGYAAMVYEKGRIPDSGHITAIAAWARLGTYEIRHYNAADLDTFIEEVDHATRHTDRYAPGECCTFCPRQLECGAREEYARSSFGALVPIAAGEVVTDEKLAEAYPKLGLVKEGLKRIDALYKARLERGPLDLGDGRELVLKEQPRESIDAAAAWPVLVEQLGEETALAAFGLTKSGLSTACGTVAARGKKAKLNRKVLDALRSIGAVSSTTHYRREVVKKDPE